jgi:hypothetical protein
LAEQHRFDSEPDFDEAMALYRAAVARGTPDPFEWCWLSEMYGRAREGKPSVTESEYEELNGWYKRNESAIRASRRDWYPFTNALPKGPRDMEVTKYVDRLRELRARFADLP